MRAKLTLFSAMNHPLRVTRLALKTLGIVCLFGSLACLNAASVQLTPNSPEITTPFVDERRATVAVETVVQNDSAKAQEVFIETILKDADGKEVARSEAGLEIAAGDQAGTNQWVNFRRPIVWTAENPYLYTALTHLWLGEEMMSSSEKQFGVKQSAVDAE